MKKTALTFLAVTALMMLPACNTIKGIGKDVQAGGEVLEETAKDVEEDIKN